MKVYEFLNADMGARGEHYDIRQVCRTGIAALKRGVRR